MMKKIGVIHARFTSIGCTSCGEIIKIWLLKIPGVIRTDVDRRGNAYIYFDPEETNVEKILENPSIRSAYRIDVFRVDYLDNLPEYSFGT